MTTSRSSGVDGLRGLAVVAMAVYHVFYVRDVRTNYRTAHREGAVAWLGVFARTTFLLLSGACSVMGSRPGGEPARTLRRAGRIAAGAAYMTLWTQQVFPQHWVRFGVLHFLAAAGVLLRPFAELPPLAAALAAGACAVTHTATHGLSLPGYAAYALGCGKPSPGALHMDYFPVLSANSGIVLVGQALARPLADLLPDAPAPLSWLGRNALEVYVAHWPVVVALAAALDGDVGEQLALS